MTKKIYRSAMGKPVDIGALMLQNEGVRAVGNMNVNARGDTVDSQNRVIETKNRQVQRQYAKQVDPLSIQKPATSNHAVRQAKLAQEAVETDESVGSDTFEDLPEDNDILVADSEVLTKTSSTSPTLSDALKGGLAGAIARSRIVQQEKEKSLKELRQDQGIRKL